MIWLPIAVLLATTLVTALILRKLIPFLKSKKMGQKILDIGPRWHKSKEGTPTMGGISFILSTLIVSTVGIAVSYAAGILDTLSPTVFTLLFALVNGLIGTVDDRTKFAKSQNEGLLPYQKFGLQLIAAGGFLLTLKMTGQIDTSLYLPFIGKTYAVGWLYYPLMLLLITGLVNSVNLADGIDGLCASETVIAGGFFLLAAASMNLHSITVTASALIGGCLGFLVYNFHPARVFMGDTGSLFLGGYLVGLGFAIGRPLLLLPVGIMYFAESLSDILQVTYFKLTHGKRIFKMAPIHHHFEKCGWGEIKIVAVFSFVTLLTSVLSYLFDIL